MKKLIITFFICSLFMPAMALSTIKKKVMVMEIKGEIDPRMSRYVKLALDHAQLIEADIIIIDMDTYGGILSDAKDIVDKIMGLNIPIWVFINRDAASAGALISIACDSIYMAPGSNIGAATVVNQKGEAAPDKYQSYMRAIMRSTAEEHGRDPDIAEGMVDETLLVEGVVKEGEVITFTTSEALQHGYCEAKVESIEDILQRNRVDHYNMVEFQLNTSEKIIAFFINPFISGLLILVILGGLYFELQSPGVGFPLFAATAALLLYLIPYYLNGLAENWEIILLFVGLALIVVEVFVIPGFGVAGISGIVLVIVALILVMLDNDFFNFDAVPLTRIKVVSWAVFGGLMGGLMLPLIFGSKISQTKFFKKLSLTMTQDVAKGYTVTEFASDLIGKNGIAYTVLRPGGKIMVDNTLYDAFSRGDYIEKNTPVQILKIEGNLLQVKKI